MKKALKDVISEGVTDEEFEGCQTPLVTKVEEMLVPQPLTPDPGPLTPDP